VEDRDYYRVLQVEPTATSEEIKAAYRRLALRYHPDLAKNDPAPEQMRKLNEAYEILGDADKRAQYDLERRVQAETVPVVVTPPPPPVKPRQNVTFRPRPRRRPRTPMPKIWVRGGLRLILSLIILVSILFTWSLITGQVSVMSILLMVILSIYAIISIIVEIRRF
jgi:hypothetical protein